MHLKGHAMPSTVARSAHYVVLQATKILELELSVNHYSSDGYTPVGGLVVYGSQRTDAYPPIKESVFAQAMFREAIII